MRISRGTFVLIQLILAAWESVRLVEASSWSDNEDKQQRMRGGSDLESGTGNSSKVSTPTPTFVNGRSIQSQHKGPKSFSLQNPLEELAPYPNSPYFAEFSRSMLQESGAGSYGTSGNELGLWSGIAASDIQDARQRRKSTEIFDLESSIKALRGLRSSTEEMLEMSTDSKWIDMIAQTALQSQQQMQQQFQRPDYEAFNFENVSNAAFIDYTVQSAVAGNGIATTAAGRSESSGTTSSASPSLQDRDILESAAKEKADDSLAVTEATGELASGSVKREAAIRELFIDTDESSTPRTTLTSKPFSYKEALEKNAREGDENRIFRLSAALKERGANPDTRSVDRRDHRASDDGKQAKKSMSSNTSTNGSVASQKRGTLNELVRNSIGKQRERDQTEFAKLERTEIKTGKASGDTKSSEKADSKSTSASNTGSNTPLHQEQQQRKPPQTSQDDIYEALMKSARSNSESSTGTKGATQPIRIKPSASSQQQQQQQQQQGYIPENAVSLNEWKSEFRMPRAFAPPPNIPNVFSFPRNDLASKRFLEQLRQFRTSLMTSAGKRIENCIFADYTPELNVYERPGTTPKASGKRVYTDSQRNKVFMAAPFRTWIPMRCDALGMEFKVERAVDGHAGLGHGKTKVSIVSNVNSNAHVRYIRKEYYDLEYFTNEYNFLQFAHHPHLPKPYCVEYGQYPSIVMEFVEGYRVHSAFYNFGRSLQVKYPDNFKMQWEDMAKNLTNVLAKLLIALRYIHSIGFIHADLKPENIIYHLQSGRITIIDFDLAVSAPYVFTGRGTEATLAPEINGLLKGPIHFGIDWWAYGSTAAMIIASALAGLLKENHPAVEGLLHYVPFKYVRSSNQYVMTPIPEFFSPLCRSFLYPFFNPDPSGRVFSEAHAYNWIRSHPMFNSVTDWSAFENLDLGIFAALTPMQLGFMGFSKHPVLLQPIPKIHKILSMFGLGGVFYSTTAISPPELKAADNGNDNEDDDEEDASEDDGEEDEEETEGEKRLTGDIFPFED